jgi:hypothetical protein
VTVGAILTLGLGSFSDKNHVVTLGFGTGATPVPPTPSTTPNTGGVYYQGLRKKRIHKPRFDEVINKAVSDIYAEIINADLPKSVKREAAQVVKPYSTTTGIPAPSKIDWKALETDAKRVQLLLQIWSDELLQREIDDEDEFLLLN